MEPRFRGPQGNPHGCGGVGQRQTQVVMQDDHGAMLRLESAEAILELVPIRQRGLVVRHRVGKDLWHGDLDAPTLDMAELIATRVEEQPVQPGIETIDVTQRGQVPPAPDERLLDGILCSIGIPEDESRSGIKPADRRASEHGEGVMIALLRSSHEIPLHGSPQLRERPGWSRLSIWRGTPAICSHSKGPCVPVIASVTAPGMSGLNTDPARARR